MRSRSVVHAPSALGKNARQSTGAARKPGCSIELVCKGQNGRAHPTDVLERLLVITRDERRTQSAGCVRWRKSAREVWQPRDESGIAGRGARGNFDWLRAGGRSAA